MYIITGFSSTRPKDFFNLYTLVNLVQSNAALGIMAIGLTFVILTGGIDLSIGSVVGWAGLVAAFLIHAPDKGQLAFLHNWNPYLAMLMVLAISTVIGAIIGF